MKDKRTHYGTGDESKLEQQICGSALILYNVRKIGPILLLLVGRTAGRQAGRQNMGGFQKF